MLQYLSKNSCVDHLLVHAIITFGILSVFDHIIHIEMKRIVYKEVFLPLAKWTIEKGAPKVLEALAKVMKFFAGVIKSIPKGLLKGIAAGILAIVAASKAAKIISRVSGWIKALKVAKDAGGWVGMLKKAFGKLKLNPYVIAIGAVVGAIVAVVTAIKTFNSTKVKAHEQEWEKAREEIDETIEKLDDCTDAIEGASDAAKDNEIEMKVNFEEVDTLKDRLKDIIKDGLIDESEKPEYFKIVTELGEKVDGFKDKWDKVKLKDINGKFKIQPDAATLQGELDDTVDAWKTAQARMVYESEISAIKIAIAQNKFQESDIGSQIEALKSNAEAFMQDHKALIDGKYQSYWEAYGGDADMFLWDAKNGNVAKKDAEAAGDAHRRRGVRGPEGGADGQDQGKHGPGSGAAGADVCRPAGGAGVCPAGPGRGGKGQPDQEGVLPAESHGPEDHLLQGPEPYGPGA